MGPKSLPPIYPLSIPLSDFSIFSFLWKCKTLEYNRLKTTTTEVASVTELLIRASHTYVPQREGPFGHNKIHFLVKLPGEAVEAGLTSHFNGTHMG